MKHVPFSNSDVNNTNTNVSIVTNTPVNNDPHVNSPLHLAYLSQHPIVNTSVNITRPLNVNNTNHSVYRPPHTPNPSINTTLLHTAPTGNSPSTITLNTPAYLYDLLTPHLLHQHSIRTAVYDLLLPLPPSSPTPISTLHTLHKLLSDSPRLHSLLPPLPPPPTPPPRAPPRARPLRAPPISYADPTEPHPFPMPCPMSFPFGDTDGVAAAPSTLSTPDSDAGLGLFGIRPKKSSYANSKQHRHLFAKKGDYICSYHGPIRTSAECISQPSMYLFSDPMDPQLHHQMDTRNIHSRHLRQTRHHPQ